MYLIRALVASALLSLLGTPSLIQASAVDQVHLTRGTDAAGNPQITLGIDPSEGFTMLIATYQRDLLLPPLIKHLTSTPPPSLRQIVIIWQNVDSPQLPDFLSPRALDEYSTSGVAVTVRKSWKNSMNERFRPVLDWGQEIETNTVMIMDDDVVLRKEALEWGYQQFLEANKYGPGRIVGFSPREFEKVGGGGGKANEWKYLTKPRESYSMILSNAAFLKKEWLTKYWEDSQEMRQLRNYVDSVFNCDDILINYVVSNLTHSPPLLLQPSTPLRTVPTEGGLWNRVVSPNDNDNNNDKPTSDSSSSSSSKPKIPDTITTSPPRPEHFSTRKECLSHYFSQFSKYTPRTTTSTSTTILDDHYPLVKTRTSISQDVQDHSRWMFENEMWETVVWSKSSGEGDTDRDEEEEESMDGELSVEEEEMLEKGDYESFLQGLSDQEVEELMQSLDEIVLEGEDSEVEEVEQTPDLEKKHIHEEL